MVYPDGEILSYAYDTGGQLKSVTGVKGSEEYNYVKGITYDEYGQRVSMTLGNGDVTNYTYDPATRRLSHLKTVNGSTVWQDMTYEYDHEGNIKSINNKDFITKDEDAKTSTQNFSYDELDRLTEASGTYSKESWLPYFTSRTNKYTDEFVYDEIGNITHKAQVNTGTYENDETKNLIDTTYTWDYAYGSSRPHAVTKTGDLSYTYDASGNMTCKENSNTKEYLKFTWDDENRLTKTEDNLNRTTYRYDDTGTRIAKKGKFGETIYASDIFTVKNGTIESTHIFAGQTRIATKVKNTSTGTTSTTPVDMGVYYYHPDHLGSSSTVTNDKGKFTEHNEYFPYGEIWVNETNSDTTLPYKFTSKELDSETGLYYYGWRYLDPKTGTWCSADPALAEYLPTGDKEKDKNLPGEGGVFKAVNLDLYHYAGNNPIRYTDPDGKQTAATLDEVSNSLGPYGSVLKIGLVAAMAASMIYDQVQSKSDEQTNKDYSDPTYYRGLSQEDFKELRTMGVIRSKALREGKDPVEIIKNSRLGDLKRNHQRSSKSSPFVSVTADYGKACKFASTEGDGSEPAYAVAEITTKRAIPNEVNNKGEEEFLIPVAVSIKEITNLYLVPPPAGKKK